MTKRYSYSKSELTDLFVISDELHKETFSGMDDEYNCSRIVRKLNTLTDENEQLRKENEELSLANRDCDILEEENEQLKQHNTELINKIDFLERVIDGDV